MRPVLQLRPTSWDSHHVSIRHFQALHISTTRGNCKQNYLLYLSITPRATLAAGTPTAVHEAKWECKNFSKTVHMATWKTCMTIRTSLLAPIRFLSSNGSLFPHIFCSDFIPTSNFTLPGLQQPVQPYATPATHLPSLTARHNLLPCLPVTSHNQL